jgi:XTP/dITP diphosphohydrolase
MEILIATKNLGKYKEIVEILQELEGVTFRSLAELGVEADFEETADSFEENALGKARFFAEHTGLITIADDSGIFIEALADELGVKTRRWGAGAEASDEEWLDFFMNRMGEEPNRKAKFVCAAALVEPGGEQVFLGETHGTITDGLEAPISPGIPLSSVFKPVSCDKVFTALGTEEKNRLSHRGNAFKQLLNHFRND